MGNLWQQKNESAQLRTYIKTTISHLGICAVKIEHKNYKRKWKWIVVPRNRQALLGMPDIHTLNFIKVNIHSIGTKHTGDSDNCCANRPTVKPD